MKHIKRILLILILLCILAAAVYVWKTRRIPAYLSDHYIVHACGSIDDKRYTNSVEALDQTLAKNVKAVEIDFSFTSDGVLVCNHGWKDFDRKAPAYETFMATPTIGGFSPMTAEQALQKLADHGKTYLIVDTQDEDVAGVYADIIRICSELKNGSNYLKKIVPQIYSMQEYTDVNALYHFSEWIFTLYKLDLDTAGQYEEIAQFCQDHGINVITMHHKRVSREITGLIHSHGCSVAVHTVNKRDMQRQFFKDGIDAIYTDYDYRAIIPMFTILFR